MSISRISPRKFYDVLVSQMPPGIERAVIRVMSYHIGKAQAISKKQLVEEIRKLGFGKEYSYTTIERMVRDSIADMCNDDANDFLIISSTGEGGYFIPATMDEYQEFFNVETSRAREIEKRLRATSSKAHKLFGPLIDKQQPGLF